MNIINLIKFKDVILIKINEVKVGNICGNYTVLKKVSDDSYECECIHCKSIKIIKWKTLRYKEDNKCPSCIKNNLVGMKFNKLTVMNVDRTIKNKRTYYICKCDCGNEVTVRSDCLLDNNTKSCGCANKDWREERFQNVTKEKLYYVWAGMKERCNNKNSTSYNDYGGRGIRVCDDWNKSDSYLTFKEWAINNGYEENKGLSIDRINVDGNYEPSNCRWVTQKIQTRNMRKNKYITYNNETHVVHDWAKILNINPNTLYHRLYTLNWSVEDAFTNDAEDNYINGVNKANEINKYNYNKRCDEIRDLVINWAKTNVELIKSYPNNKLNYIFKKLIIIIEKEYGIKDMRTVSKACCNSSSNKELLLWIRNKIM